MALTEATAIRPRYVGGADDGLADKRRAEARYQELKRELAELREAVQRCLMAVDSKLAERAVLEEAGKDDRIPDILARIARLETNRGPGRPPNTQR